MKKIFEGIAIGLVLGAIGASAKAISDVSALKESKETTREMFKDIKNDIRDIREKIYEINKRN